MTNSNDQRKAFGLCPGAATATHTASGTEQDTGVGKYRNRDGTRHARSLHRTANANFMGEGNQNREAPNTHLD